MEIQLEEMRLARLRIEELLAAHTGQPIERVSADIERDYIVRGQDAVDYGLVDEVITHRQTTPPPAQPMTPGYATPKEVVG